MENTTSPFQIQPPHIAHVDWSINPRKRWLVAADRRDGVYHLAAAQPFDKRILHQSPSLLLGVDFPLGLPLAYADAVSVPSFRAFCESIRRGERESFFEVADSPAVISLQRPLYPKRPGGTNMQQLLDGLGFTDKQALYRWCDRATAMRRAGANIFWTMGAIQVGKGMLRGWREILLPNWDRVALWPFDGDLADLMDAPLVLAEAYPGEFYHHLGMFQQRGSKRNQAARQREGQVLLRWAAAVGVVMSAELCAQITDGFGPTGDGEDPFDAAVGLCGMLNVILGRRAEMPKLPPTVRQIEGWVFGQTAYPLNIDYAPGGASTTFI